MATSRRTFRLFVSSTFSDFEDERNALQAHVFPRLSELAGQFGFRFQAIDLRWGIRPGAALDHATVDVCLKEVERCRTLSPPPNFLVLLGDRYGWRPLPSRIDQAECEELLAMMTADDRAHVRWQETDDGEGAGWYRLDDNAVPAKYVLLPRKHRATDGSIWPTTERRLRAHFQDAIVRAAWPVDDPRRTKYEASATHHEVLEGLLPADESSGGGFAFIRSITNIEAAIRAGSNMRRFSDFVDLDETGYPDQAAGDRLRTLKEGIREKLGDRVTPALVSWNGSGIGTAHLTAMCSAVLDQLSRVIRQHAALSGSVSSVDAEAQAHRAFGVDRRRLFTGRRATLAALDEYLAAPKDALLVVAAAPGLGKSALMARAVQLAEERAGATVVYRSIGATPESTDGVSLLKTVLGEMKPSALPQPDEYEKLADAVRSRLTSRYTNGLEVVVIDAVDQLPAGSPALDFRWLPEYSYDGPKVILSVSDVAVFRRLQARIPRARLLELPPMAHDEGDELLGRLLAAESRTLQPRQRAEVLQRFHASGSPLFLTLVLERVKRWRSFDDSRDNRVADDVPGLIRSLVARLCEDAEHGKVLVSRALGYLAASRFGVSEDEFAELLSRDADVREEFQANAVHKPGDERLPTIIWSRLLRDLDPYLGERMWEGSPLLAFHHRMFLAVATHDMLDGDDARLIHERLASFFDHPAWWKAGPNTPQSTRALSELPYHQRLAGLWENAECTLTDIDFIKARCAMSVHRLLDDYAELLRVHPEPRGDGHRRLTLVSRALDLSSKAIAAEPGRVTAELHGRLFGVADDVAREILSPAVETGSTSWLSPLTPSRHSATGPLRRTLEHSGRYTTDIALSGGDSAIAAAVADDRLFVWDAKTGALAQQTEFKESIHAVCIDGAGRRVFCGNRSGRIYVWDLDTRRVVHTLDAHFWQVSALALTPDGQMLVSGSAQNIVKFWDLASLTLVDVWDPGVGGYSGNSLPPDGRIQRTPPSPPDASVQEPPKGTSTIPELSVLTISADGRYLAVAWKSGFVTILCLARRDEFWHLRSDRFCMFYSAALSPDGRFAVAPYNALYVWDVETGHIVGRFELPKHHPDVVACAPGVVLSGSNFGDQSLCAWDLTNGALLHRVQGQTGQIRKIIVSADGQWAVSSSTFGDDNKVRVWELAALGSTQASGHIRKVFDIDVSRDGTRAATSSHDQTIKIWDLATGREVRSIALKRSFVYLSRFSDDGEKLLACPGELAILDVRSGGLVAIVCAPESTDIDAETSQGSRPIEPFSMSADGRLIAFVRLLTTYTKVEGKFKPVGETQNIMTIWQCDSQSTIESWPVACKAIDRVWFTRDRARVAALIRRVNAQHLDDWYYTFWDVKTGAEIATFPALGCWEKEGRIILVDSRRTVMDVDSGIVLGHLPDRTYIRAVSADGRRAVVGAPDGLQVWSVPNCQLLLEVGDAALQALSHDGSHLAFATGPLVELWDVDARKQVGTFTGDGEISALALTPDGATVVAGEEGGRVHFLRQAGRRLTAVDNIYGVSRDGVEGS